MNIPSSFVIAGVAAKGTPIFVAVSYTPFLEYYWTKNPQLALSHTSEAEAMTTVIKLNTAEHNKPLLNDDGTYRPMNIMELTFNKVTEVTFIDHTLL